MMGYLMRHLQLRLVAHYIVHLTCSGNNYVQKQKSLVFARILPPLVVALHSLVMCSTVPDVGCCDRKRSHVNRTFHSWYEEVAIS